MTRKQLIKTLIELEIIYYTAITSKMSMRYWEPLSEHSKELFKLLGIPKQYQNEKHYGKYYTLIKRSVLIDVAVKKQRKDLVDRIYHRLKGRFMW